MDFEELNKILIVNSENRIVVNIVYAPVEGGYIGAFSGDSGGIFDYRVFYIDEDEVANIDDDCDALDIPDPEVTAETFSELEGERFKFEDEDDDGALSKEGQAFIDDVEEDNGLKTKYSSSASEDIIYSLQDEWSINFFLDD